MILHSPQKYLCTSSWFLARPIDVSLAPFKEIGCLAMFHIAAPSRDPLASDQGARSPFAPSLPIYQPAFDLSERHAVPVRTAHQRLDPSLRLEPLNSRRDDLLGKAQTATVLPSIASLLSTTPALHPRDLPFPAPRSYQPQQDERQSAEQRLYDYRRGREASQRVAAENEKELRAALPPSRFTPVSDHS